MISIKKQFIHWGLKEGGVKEEWSGQRRLNEKGGAEQVLQARGGLGYQKTASRSVKNLNIVRRWKQESMLQTMNGLLLLALRFGEVH